MKKIKISSIINITFILLVFIGLPIYMFKVDGIDNIIKVLKSVNYWWVIMGIILIVIYWLLEGLCFYVLTKKIYKKQRFISSFRLAMIGRLFNNITPFSCGDQPAQLITMKNEGKSLSNGVSILLTRFIVYQAVLIIYTLIIVIFKYSYFKQLLNNYMYLAIIGFIINMLVIMFLIAIIINERIVYNIIRSMIIFLSKFKIIKNVDESSDNIKKIILDFVKQLNIIKKEKFMIFKICLYTAIEITVLYTITYVVYRAFGQNSVDFITILSAQTILALITVYMPTPGASIAAEGGFYIMFKTFFTPNTIDISILFWRMYTFYLPIIVGLIFLVYKPKIIPEEINEEVSIE
ncbi:MAG: lysylphosphatidylglycerol synthase transmembrane domain-containing protein [Clostridia bacterium]|nr:lysylphosphatidylglycerol synthase transmembrane domain-containing protein [Clostridia bacterium]MDD4386708.1 lysylphosphatidylglycerol synthase transmembrane domain-containing protein [Clostridia bacterium]